MDDNTLMSDRPYSPDGLVSRRSELIELGETDAEADCLEFELCKGIICPLD